MSASQHESERLFGGKPVMHIDHPVDRRNFFRWAGILGVGAGLVAVGCGTEDDAAQVGASPGASASISASDLEILNYALTLEHLEAEFYRRGVESTVLADRQLEIIRAIGSHESDHVSQLTSTIRSAGGQPAEKPTFTFPENTFSEGGAFLKTASTFEELGVNAYHGQVTRIQSPAVLAAAASIAGIESRHAAVLAFLLGTEPFPAPIEASKDMPAVLEAARPFIES